MLWPQLSALKKYEFKTSGLFLGVWAAEGFEEPKKFFDPSESFRLHYFNVGKGSDTLENVFF